MENCPKVQEPLIAHLLLLKRCFKTIKYFAMDTTQSLVACHPSSVALILLHCQSSPITHVLTLCFLLLNPLPTNLPCASIVFPYSNPQPVNKVCAFCNKFQVPEQARAAQRMPDPDLKFDELWKVFRFVFT